METIIWTQPMSKNAPGTGTKVVLHAGDELGFDILETSRRIVFGVDLDVAVGRVMAHREFWAMANFSTDSTFVVENLEGGSELVKVPPRRLFLPVPFELSRVSIPRARQIHEFDVYAPPVAQLEKPDSMPLSDGPLLDTTSKYFLVLVALCEPRLRGNSMAPIPSVYEVTCRLRTAARFRNANRSSVNYHIDYLVKDKLRISKWAGSLEGNRLHSKREALVAYALRYDLVREEHLQLLPGRCER